MIVRTDSASSCRQGADCDDDWDLMQFQHASELGWDQALANREIMEGSGDGSPQSSMCMVKAAELFPKPVLEKEEEKLTVRFTELAGESVRFLGQTDDGILALSNYRLFLQKNSSGAEVSVPLGLIESTQVRDLFHLIVNCKDASTVRCSFATSEQCSEWHRRITLSIGVPESLEALFAFPFHAWASESPTLNQDNEWAGQLQRVGSFEDEFRREAERLQFDLHGAWRISQANAEFKLCPSYPRLLLVPACVSDDTLQNVASFRSSRRIPAVVWRHQRTGAVIARCSQPEVGWLGWRNSKDEQLLKALSDACSFDRGTQDRTSDGTRRTRTQTDSSEASSSEGGGGSPPRSPEGSHEEVEMDEPKKILIVDARSYTSAVTNRARGGGCECAEYYPCAEIQFMSLGNIHVIRKSFHALRQLCASQADIPNWLGLLERTLWLQHLSGLLAASMVVCHAIERNGRPVLVHCSDGWDRTPQIVATAQLCLDPYYRTIEGFRVLVEREWLSFGHKFADRCGHGPGSDETNERCPVFLQWLDCVHQIHRQFPCSFEFDMGYLIKLAQHSHSCLFGTFLCNTVKERQENSVPDRTFSVWPFLSGPIYKNHLYVPNRERVLWPAHNVRDLRLWTEVYLGSWGGNNQQSASEVADYPASALPVPTAPDGVSAVAAASASVVGVRSIGSASVIDETGGEGASPSVNVAVDGLTTTSSSSMASSSPEQNGSMTKTRSYSDIKEATSGGVITRRSSDPSMTVDTSIINRTGGAPAAVTTAAAAALNLSQEESSIDSNLSSDRETSPDLPSLDERLLLHRGPVVSSFVQRDTEKLQSLTQELNQSDEELEQAIKNQRNLANGSTTSTILSSSSTSSSLVPNGGIGGGIDSLAAAAAATLIPTATTNVRPSFTTSTSIGNGDESSLRYRFQPIVPELPTVEASRCSPPVLTASRESSSSPPIVNPTNVGGFPNQRLVMWPAAAIDENTSRIIKIESYQSTTVAGNKDVLDGGGGGGGGVTGGGGGGNFVESIGLGRGGVANRTVIGRPIMGNDDIMLESVDLTVGGTDENNFAGETSLFSTSPNRLESPGLNESCRSPNLWHGSIETSTDTLVPVDQYPLPLGASVSNGSSTQQDHRLSNLAKTAADGELRTGHDRQKDDVSGQAAGTSSRGGGGDSDSISLAVGNSDSSQLRLVNGKGSEPAPANVASTVIAGDNYATKTQTGDSNGCDFTSDSQDYDRKLSNQSTLALTSDVGVTLPKDRTDNRCVQHHPEATLDIGGGRSSLTTITHNSNASGGVIFSKLKANGGGAPVSVASANSLLSSTMLMDESIIIQPQFQQLEINGKHSTADGGPLATQKERRRRNSSNSKHDLMSPCKPTNGSISPSATHSRFSTPGARSLPLTPPSVPYMADRPPVATFSCPDGLAHALSEQNLRLQQIVYEHRLREEALQRELYATRLALLKKTCQNCCSSSAQQQYGNEDPVPVGLSITSVAAFSTATNAASLICGGGGGGGGDGGDECIIMGRVSDRGWEDASNSSSRASASMSTTITSHSRTTTITTEQHSTACCYDLLSKEIDGCCRSLLMFSDEEEEEEEIEEDDEQQQHDQIDEGALCTGDKNMEERFLCHAILTHDRRLAHNVRICRTIRRFLERTRQKRTAGGPPPPTEPCLLLDFEPACDTSDSSDSGDGSEDGHKMMKRGRYSDAGRGSRPGGRIQHAGGKGDLMDVGAGGGYGGDGHEDEHEDAELSSQLMVDSMNENASNCSWEAVDERSAPSSGANSSQQMQYSSSGVGCSTSVLWVPDHAVTRCTTCQTEFWLGRRKHHCRSCGQIFCADCSEFTAHLPDERIYQPVRLCGPCYQRISSMTVPSSTTGSGNTPGASAVPVSSGSSSSTTNQLANGAGSSSITAAPTHAPAAAVTAPLSDDPNAAFLQARSNVTMMMRDRITSMSQIQSLLAAECSSEASRASDNCCKQNVTAAATN